MVVGSNNFENNYRITKNDQKVQHQNRLIQQFMNDFNDEKRQKVTDNNNKMFGAKQSQYDDVYDNEDAFDDEDEDEEEEEDEEELALDDQIQNLYDELYSEQDYNNDNYYDINDELLYTINALQSYYDENQMKSLNGR